MPKEMHTAAGTDLSAFREEYSAIVAGWAGSPAEAAMWCGRADFPFPPEVVVSWQSTTYTRSYVLRSGQDIVAYGELWFDTEENEAELARIVVALEARGQGMGKELVRRLTTLAMESGYKDIFMRVHPDNLPALRCYQRTGFLPVDARLAAEWNSAQPIDYVWLQHFAIEEES
ncbi:GNAT family N-acetyltransferase [Streptomyces sp. NPDC015127]|uniref:GNAT family N-acetyltransferase n=1 Tax=Streptomyces sp. NPDC015127 TaxID=3364939 RepID=UPI0036F93400